MSENKITATTRKLKKMIEDSFPDKTETVHEPEPVKQPATDVEISDIIVTDEQEVQTFHGIPKNDAEPGCIESLKEEVSQLRMSLESMRSDMDRYATSKEQFKTYSEMMNRRDAELADRKFIGMLEQLSAMREDFFKLCKGIDGKLDKLSAKDVLNSFEAYGVDMENILTDCGVAIGPFKYERLNTVHQRIVDVIPTNDESMNSMIADRISDGYAYNGRVLFKERVNIYKFSENIDKTKGDE